MCKKEGMMMKGGKMLIIQQPHHLFDQGHYLSHTITSLNPPPQRIKHTHPPPFHNLK
jgi:hypothetical protein